MLSAAVAASSSSADFCVVRPIDPNDKIGPSGVGPNRVVSVQDEMEYMVRFENFALASAPVQELIVVDYLDAGLDWTTARFKELAYGDHIVTPPVGSLSFTIRDQPPTNSTVLTGSAVGQMVVDVSGTINPQTGRMEWRLSAIDTNTGFFPTDALSGFLPPENGTGRGQGHVKLSVRPKNDVPLGTVITNTATIVFDGNAPITTPPVWNTIGQVEPKLGISIDYLEGEIRVGVPFTYTLTVTNSGLKEAAHVVLTNSVSAGFVLVSASVNQGTVTATNGLVIADLGSETNGMTAKVTVVVSPVAEGTFTNTVTIGGAGGMSTISRPVIFDVIGEGPPALGLRLLNNQIEITWPAAAAGFVLETVESLAWESPWESVTNAPMIVGGQNTVRLETSSSSRFFRLKKQSAGP